MLGVGLHVVKLHAEIVEVRTCLAEVNELRSCLHFLAEPAAAKVA